MFFCLFFIKDMQVSGVEDDSRALNIVIHKPSSNPHAKPLPILQANFIFADHIRCIIAKQRLAKGRIQARRMKMQRIAGKWGEKINTNYAMQNRLCEYNQYIGFTR